MIDGEILPFSFCSMVDFTIPSFSGELNLSLFSLVGISLFLLSSVLSLLLFTLIGIESILTLAMSSFCVVSCSFCISSFFEGSSIIGVDEESLCISFCSLSKSICFFSCGTLLVSYLSATD